MKQYKISCPIINGFHNFFVDVEDNEVEDMAAQTLLEGDIIEDLGISDIEVDFDSNLMEFEEL